METPPYPRNAGKIIRTWKAIDDQPTRVRVEAEILRPQKSAAHPKVLYLQKLRFEADGRLEYRFTYYMLGHKKGRMEGRWVFGQYSVAIPAKDLAWLLAKAKKLGWEGF